MLLLRLVKETCFAFTGHGLGPQRGTEFRVGSLLVFIGKPLTPLYRNNQAGSTLADQRCWRHTYKHVIGGGSDFWEASFAVSIAESTTQGPPGFTFFFFFFF